MFNIHKIIRNILDYSKSLNIDRNGGVPWWKLSRVAQEVNPP